MSKNLVIVESPTKARTISRFLSDDFTVRSSVGHVRDLPASRLGIDIEHNFEPHYLVPKKANAVVSELRKEAKKAKKVILATDEDREGEAIAWHLVHALDLEGKKKGATPKTTERIVFHEITKRAIEEALKHPRAIDLNLVDAQQARRILDRLVGYTLSPFLWKKIYRGLSAGRVQSVAVRLIVEREREIQNFKKEEYWTIVATLLKDAEKFEAALVKIGDSELEKFSIKDAAAAIKITDVLKDAAWKVEVVEKRAISKNPLPPFTTSTLQQEAFARLRFSARQTMLIAQQLYEGVELGKEGAAGLITYMRTDSLNLSADAIAAATEFIRKAYGEQYALPSPRHFKAKTKGAQEAHEAIRPTDPARAPEMLKNFLDSRQFKLYDLIWRRFIATQMPAAILENTSAMIQATPASEKNLPHVFRASGQSVRFDGFLKVYPLKVHETLLPNLVKNDTLMLHALTPVQHFTEPPPRFSEATLIKALEKYGIGRPSTYAPILSTIQERKYVERDEKRRLAPTEIGYLVNDMLVEHFPEIVDIQFTANMEERLDEIAEGKKEWRPVIREFYIPYAKRLEEKMWTVKKHGFEEPTNELCEKCGKPMVIRLGRFGKFLACTGFPECKNTKTIKAPPETIGMKCPKCLEGDITIKKTKRGRIFYGCSQYPQCDFASWTDPRKEKGPKPSV